jgi:hypothetical protein
MPGTHVVVKLPGTGTLFGEAVARNPGSRMTSVVAGRHEHQGRPFLDHLALVEGLPDDEVARLLLSWGKRYGEPPQVLGGPFALRLPIALDVQHTAAASTILRLEHELPDVSHRFAESTVELWSPCGTRDLAERRAAQLETMLRSMPVLWLGTAEPRPEDADCWSLLRTAAAEVVPDCLVAS